MPKAFCMAGAAVAILLLLVFGADLAVQIPFGRQSMLMDIGIIICSGILAYMSWSAYQQIQ